jgi:AraC family transcriptional activator of mar-sox-rob regulon
MPKHEFVTLPGYPADRHDAELYLFAGEISDFRNQMRVQFWRDFLGNSPSIPPELYGLHETRPSRKKTTSRRCSTPPR